MSGVDLAIQHRRLAFGGTSPTSGAADDETLWNQKAVIIVGSLLFFIIFTLALIPLAKCALRFMHLESPREMEIRLANTGLKHKVVQSFPTIIYETQPPSSTVSTASFSSSSSSFSSPECPICLAQFAEGDKLRLMPSCFHGFHVNCIDKWLLAHSSCPICRHSLLSDEKA